jgi:hypothetical protein
VGEGWGGRGEEKKGRGGEGRGREETEKRREEKREKRRGEGRGGEKRRMLQGEVLEFVTALFDSNTNVIIFSFCVVLYVAGPTV